MPLTITLTLPDAYYVHIARNDGTPNILVGPYAHLTLLERDLAASTVIGHHAPYGSTVNALHWPTNADEFPTGPTVTVTRDGHPHPATIDFRAA